MKPDELVRTNIYYRTKEAYQTLAKHVQVLAEQHGIATTKPSYRLTFNKNNNPYFHLRVRTTNQETLLSIDSQIDEDSLALVLTTTNAPDPTLARKISDYTNSYLTEHKQNLQIAHQLHNK